MKENEAHDKKGNMKSITKSNSTGTLVSRWSKQSSSLTSPSPGRWMQFCVGMLCGTACLSLMAAYFFYVKPCDFLGADYDNSSCHMRAVPSVSDEQTETRRVSDITASSQTQQELPHPKPRVYSDDEIASHAVARDVLMRHSNDRPAGSKIAFMFMTPGPLPLELVWEDFFAGHEGLYSIFVHASELKYYSFEWKSSVFKGRAIPSRKVFWGRIEMVDAERRLLSYALLDPANMFFVLLSDTCIPLFDFNHVYNYLMGADKSFVESYDDPGIHGRGRYLKHMQPEIQVEDWRKGPQWIALHREHAMIVVLDRVYYKKFKTFCKPGMDRFNCVPDEHYIPTFLNIMDPRGLANRSLTYADWSERKWHPRAFGKDDVTPYVLMEMQSVTTYDHVSSTQPPQVISNPCLWNGEHQHCFLFARKFLPDSADVVRQILPGISQPTYT